MIAYALLFILITANAVLDAALLRSGKTIDAIGHWQRFALRYVALSLLACWSFGFDGVNFGWQIFSLLLYFSAIFWIAFDALLNLMWGKPLWYVGNTAATDAVFSPKWTQFVAKGAYLAFTYWLHYIHFDFTIFRP